MLDIVPSYCHVYKHSLEMTVTIYCSQISCSCRVFLYLIVELCAKDKNTDDIF